MKEKRNGNKLNSKRISYDLDHHRQFGLKHRKRETERKYCFNLIALSSTYAYILTIERRKKMRSE